MLLAIDTGNTNTLFAIHNGTDWVVEWRIATNAARTADEYAVWFHQLMEMQGLKFTDVTGCIIASVVPQSLFNMRNLARRHLNVEPMIVGEGDLDLGTKALIDNPEQAGADRLVNVVGALTRYKAPLIIVDSGTATTFDVVDEDGNFIGGIITPGINLSVRALHEAAARLPRIEIRRPSKVVGTNTVESMQSGIFWGYIGLIDGLVNRIKQERSDLKFTVIGTGGIASLFEGASDTIEHYDSRLTIDGLFEIYRRNGGAKR
ncbi:type III pantothenate kinase [Robiginitomaculum antarcticum]|uniref:type III pantothenate kinase n=1 Tax=Robiginitomaculum antarcticum TaxID=437507 RepID=UPI00036E391F|nr:type III pantothenate kinase [Robiginitomaculum antarcticum]